MNTAQPTIVDADGTRRWLKNGVPHSEGDTPAVVYPDGMMEWYTDGILDRDGDKPARINPKAGEKYWYKKVSYIVMEIIQHGFGLF